MEALVWIIAGGVAMSAVSLVGAAALLLRAETLKRIALPLVAFSAGSLLGGAFFHMLPASQLRCSTFKTFGGAVAFFPQLLAKALAFMRLRPPRRRPVGFASTTSS